ncbi:MAG: hydroxymethylglutaryl-CoA reductase, degradative [Proteobacteria bacterium]|nr:hydroxymethylglutaryl-CoA reductase, degradative [Pseudomonadota bacterium]
MSDSRVAGLYRLGVDERIVELERLGWLSSAQAQALRDGTQIMSVTNADKMIENVFGVFALPFAIAPNFVINGQDCIVPLVVEEASIVAALSSAARLARETGGFVTECDESLLIGQIHVTGVADRDSALTSLRASASDLIDVADKVHPRLRARGGGVRGMEFRALELPDGSPLLAVHVLVDTCDAMGANLVNTICELIAPLITDISGGDVALRILSNLTDRSIVKARVSYSLATLAGNGMNAESVRDGIVLASNIARVDPHRATTHNKGIMNGIDALAIATGNDWRAIEAGAHAYAARNGSYSPLAQWSVGTRGELLGEIEIPLKTGIVGGSLALNPAVAIGLAVAAPASAQQLSAMMAAVGLAQNFSALRALVTSGIQKGHMKLHARGIVASIGTPDDRFDEVVEELVASGEVKNWKAQEILDSLSADEIQLDANSSVAAGKVILFGEHAVVYGRHALALPISGAVHATIVAANDATTLHVRGWGLKKVIDKSRAQGIDAAIALIIDRLDAHNDEFDITVISRLPRGMGLGSSAAIAVAITRAFGKFMQIELDDERVNAIAFECEKLAHGTPSGIDNTLATYGQAMLFRNKGALEMQPLALAEEPPLLIALSNAAGCTHAQVEGVGLRYQQNSSQFDALFDQIDDLSQQGAALLQAREYVECGRLMNICHGLLNAIQVSTPELECMIALARGSGAAGAKLTGAGGGGAMVALCPGNCDGVRDALQQAGYRTLRLSEYAN